MSHKSRRWEFILPAVLIACLLVFLVGGGLFFTKHLRNQIYQERTMQLVEVTSQVRTNLDNALNSHWNYLTTAINLLNRQGFSTAEDVPEYINTLERLLETDKYSSILLMLDDQGNYYDTEGKHGVWSDIDLISTGEEQYTFITDSYIHQGSYWAFVRKLDAPLETKTGDTIFTHVVFLKDVHALTEYYDSAAYGSQNETYILKSNGTRMYDNANGERTIRAYNVLRVLEGMEGQSIPDVRAALSETSTISTNFYSDGTEYYYCLTSLEKYDTLLLFLIPAEFVAVSTVSMVGTIVRTLFALAVALLLMLMLAVAAGTPAAEWRPPIPAGTGKPAPPKGDESGTGTDQCCADGV